MQRVIDAGPRVHSRRYGSLGSISLLLMMSLCWLSAGSAGATCALCTPVDTVWTEAVNQHPVALGLPLSSSSGPAVQLGWTNPASLGTPGRVAVYRGIAGQELEEVWSCNGICPVTSFFDVTGLLEGVSYDYQVVVSDGLGSGGGSEVGSVTTKLNSPMLVSAGVYPGGEIELSWERSPAAQGYRIDRRDVRSRTTVTLTEIDGALSKYVDESAVTDAPYFYEVYGCGVYTSEGGCSNSGMTFPSSVLIGGDQLIHGLDEWVTRSRFLPFDDLLDTSIPGNPFSPSQRLIFRDDATGARISGMTKGGRSDRHYYSNSPVWNIDGSRMLFQTFLGAGAGWQVMESDGTEIRKVQRVGDLSATLFNLRWSYTDPSLLYYFNRAGQVGRVRPPSSTLPQAELGSPWEPGVAFTMNFFVTFHPDGSRAIGTHGFGDVSATEEGSTSYLIDLDEGSGSPVLTTDRVIPLVDQNDDRIFAHQVWFTGASDHSSTYNGEDVDGQWLHDMTTDVVDCSFADCSRGTHLGYSPDASKIARISDNGFEIFDMTTVPSSTSIEAQLPAIGTARHATWDVDDDWFVVSDFSSVWRVWTDGHSTRIATPYSGLVYQGERNTEIQPQVSRDGTKVAMKSPMLGSVDLYVAEMKLPDPPRFLALNGSNLEWDEPDHAMEIESYNVWRSADSGQGYALFANVSASVCDLAPCSFSVGNPSGFFYRVTAVEHSDLEGMPSNEATSEVGADRRLWFEPHEGAIARPLAPVFDGDSTGLYALEAVAGNAPVGQGAVTLSVPAGSYWVWALTKGGGGGDQFDLYNGADTGGVSLGSVAADTSNWEWVEISGGSLSVIDSGLLTLAPSAIGVAVDQVLLTNEPAFVPTEVAKRLHTSPTSPDPVNGLTASPGRFRCELSWSDPDAENFSHFNVYASTDSSTTEWDQHRLVASVVKPEFVDWGLHPGEVTESSSVVEEWEYEYRVSTVDRHGNESSLVATTCSPDALERYHVELLPADPAGVLQPNPVTGGWILPHNIPAAAAGDGFVAWLRVHVTDTAPLSDDLLRTVAGVTRTINLDTEMLPITQETGRRPEVGARMWVYVSLTSTTNTTHFSPSPLAPGPGALELVPSLGIPIENLRVSGIVMTNDLSYLPAGITDYLFPDARPGTPQLPGSPECNDGKDNDGDGLIDYVDNDIDGEPDTVSDPGCDDLADVDEHSVAIVCDDGVDNDGDGETDFADPGCTTFYDESEFSEIAQCDDGIDNDQDSKTDMDDTDCLSLSSTYEEIPDCDDGLDNDGDSLVDRTGLDLNGDNDVSDPGESSPDAGCWGRPDRSEEFDCADGIDNDGDGAIDYPDDLGCLDDSSPRENPACSDGVDNDGDGLIDFDGGPGGGTPDDGCKGDPSRWLETIAEGCGLGGELALLLPLVFAVRRRVLASRLGRNAT